jgi:hypothetical protein
MGGARGKKIKGGEEGRTTVKEQDERMSLLIHLFHFNSFHIPSVQNRLLLTMTANKF